MIGYGPPIWAHLMLWALMIMILASLRVGGMRDNWVRRREERARLRIALLAELRALRNAYRINAPYWQQGQAGLSGRSFFAMFRGNMGRVLLLSEPEVAAVVRAHASSEALDEALALRGRTGKHRGLETTVQIEDFELAQLQNVARSHCRSALEVLAAAAAADAAWRPWRARAWEAVRRAAGGKPAPQPAPEESGAEVIPLPALAARAEAAPDDGEEPPARRGKGY